MIGHESEAPWILKYDKDVQYQEGATQKVASKLPSWIGASQVYAVHRLYPGGVSKKLNCVREIMRVHALTLVTTVAAAV